MTIKQDAIDEDAYNIWKRLFAKKIAYYDHFIVPYLNKEIEAWVPNKISWLEIVRRAINLSTSAIANKVGKDRSAFRYFEKSEKSGTISLNTLYQICEAMDCELVFAIRPKLSRTFSRALWEKLLPYGKNSFSYKVQSKRHDFNDRRRAVCLSYQTQAAAFDRKTTKELGISRKKILLDPPLIPPNRRNR